MRLAGTSRQVPNQLPVPGDWDLIGSSLGLLPAHHGVAASIFPHDFDSLYTARSSIKLHVGSHSCVTLVWTERGANDLPDAEELLL